MWKFELIYGKTPHMNKKKLAISVNNISKKYKNGINALNKVSFSVEYGEIFGLLGPNGAGKSTTIRILATLTKMTSGLVSVAGYDISSSSHIVRKKIGYVAQSSGIDKWATGRENLHLQAHLERVPKKLINKRINYLLDWIGLSKSANQIVNTYSGGMKRRLEIAMGLVHEPEVLFLDEPTTGLDPETRHALWKDLKRLRIENNMTVLITTHYLEEADHLCDNLAIIDQGTLIVKGSPEYLKSQIDKNSIEITIDENKIDQAISKLKKIPGISYTSKKNNILHLNVKNGPTLMPLIISSLNDLSINVTSISFSNASLDDVYLKHTGQNFEK